MILKEIRSMVALKEGRKGKNSMGVSEEYYNPYFLIGDCFEMKELEKKSQQELESLLKLANFTSKVFY